MGLKVNPFRQEWRDARPGDRFARKTRPAAIFGEHERQAALQAVQTLRLESISRHGPSPGLHDQ